jgi:hypothetical protein
MHNPGQQPGIGLPLLGRVPEHRLELRAHVQVRARDVDRPHVGAKRQLLDERAIPGRRHGELILGLLALADVLDLADEVRRLTRLITHERDAQQRPHRPAGVVEISLFQLVVADLAGECLSDQLEVGIKVVGVGEILERLRQ